MELSECCTTIVPAIYDKFTRAMIRKTGRGKSGTGKPPSDIQIYNITKNKREPFMVKLVGEPLVILLVEDNEDHAELVLRSLKDHRVANIIYHANDGEKALDFLFHRGRYEEMKNSPRPNLILLDLRLPKVDGLDVLRTVKETPHLMQIPIVILTSSEAEKDVARAFDYHANSYVVKPLEFKKFTRLMEDIGGYWLGWNMVPLHDLDKDPRSPETNKSPFIPL
jgi:CheY-like chemotaxis protein